MVIVSIEAVVTPLNLHLVGINLLTLIVELNGFLIEILLVSSAGCLFLSLNTEAGSKIVEHAGVLVVTRGKIAPRTFYVKLESDAIDHWVV